jgi:dihydrofolate reductase
MRKHHTESRGEIMRPLVVTTFLTLDGVMQAPGGPGEDPSGGFSYEGWLVPHFDEALGEQMSSWFVGAQDFLLGRGTYDIFYASWPKMISDDPVSQGLNYKTKYVASRSVDSVEWDTARLIEGDVADAVRALKAEDGGELQVHGSAGLIQTLLEEDLVDELRVVLAPVTVGDGKRLFGDGTIPRTWRLTAHSVTSSGVLLLTYQRVGEIGTGSFMPE